MAISKERALRHIKERCRALQSSQQRKFWPQYLYHVTHVTNAIDIIKAGGLFSRSSNPNNFVDVANQGALGHFTGSHKYARLYFRPKNGYHLRVEGIKCLCDPYRQENQISIPVTFLFQLDRVITLPGAAFSAGNPQRNYDNPIQDTEAAFNNFDFDAIYNDSSLSDENKAYIHDRRQAEVLIPDVLPLKDNVKAVVFRSKWDLETFISNASFNPSELPFKLAVEQVHGSIYLHWGLYK